MDSLAKWLSDHLWTRWLWVPVLLPSLRFQISHLSRAKSSLIFRQLQSEESFQKLMWQHKNTESVHHVDKYSKHRSIFRASLAIWLSVLVRTTWLWIRIPLQSLRMFLVCDIFCDSNSYIFKCKVSPSLEVFYRERLFLGPT